MEILECLKHFDVVTLVAIFGLFLWFQKRLEKFEHGVNKKFGKIDKTFEKKFENIDKKFEKIDKKFEKIDKKFDKRFERMESRMEDQFRELNANVTDVDRRLCRIEGHMGCFDSALAPLSKHQEIEQPPKPTVQNQVVSES